MYTISVGNLNINQKSPFFCIAGPCVLEDYDTVMSIAEGIFTITERLKIPWIFKSSYCKDNRSKADSYAGPGIDEGLKILEKIRSSFDVPVLSDVHSTAEVNQAAEVLDIIQIPAFLCQQTSLLLSAGKSGKPINIKKGQFLSPYDIKNPIRKIESTGNNNILITERGNTFGYERLIVDMCSMPIMKAFGYPVILDATHAVRVYGKPSDHPEGGYPQFVAPLSWAGVASGCSGLFLETHTEPKKAKCDASSMIDISELERILVRANGIYNLLNNENSGAFL
jgi:2-dehydro-3-deoxyphosphooctonate aldolase (KDO 8-P synthase)